MEQKADNIMSETHLFFFKKLIDYITFAIVQILKKKKTIKQKHAWFCDITTSYEINTVRKIIIWSSSDFVYLPTDKEMISLRF